MHKFPSPTKTVNKNLTLSYKVEHSLETTEPHEACRLNLVKLKIALAEVWNL